MCLNAGFGLELLRARADLSKKLKRVERDENFSNTSELSRYGAKELQFEI